MKHFFLLVVLSAVLGTTLGWAMNYVEYGRRDAYFGEITYDGSVTADNVMAKLQEYHTDSAAIAELQGDADYDFGVMAPGTKGKHTFVVKNTGKEPLTLELGATTCKCTLGDLKKNQLQPGESTPIELEWTVSSGETFEQSAELRTNDPLNPAIQLTVSGLVIGDLEFDPKRISFDEVTAGESFEFSTKLYSYYDSDLEMLDGSFGSEELSELSEVTFEPFEPTEADGVHQSARQAFRVTASVKPGLRQGPMLTNLLVNFKKLDATEDAQDDADGKGDEDGLMTAVTEVAGRVVGSLSILENSKLKSTERGGYVWSLGRLQADEPLEFKAFVALKGSQRDETNLTIGETYPSDVIEAKIGEPLGKSTMRLFPLTLTLKAGDQPRDLLGKNQDDFGLIWIESDNPKVGRMKLAVKVFVEPRP